MRILLLALVFVFLGVNPLWAGADALAERNIKCTKQLGQEVVYLPDKQESIRLVTGWSKGQEVVGSSVIMAPDNKIFIHIGYSEQSKHEQLNTKKMVDRIAKIYGTSLAIQGREITAEILERRPVSINGSNGEALEICRTDLMNNHHCLYYVALKSNNRLYELTTKVPAEDWSCYKPAVVNMMQSFKSE